MHQGVRVTDQIQGEIVRPIVPKAQSAIGDSAAPEPTIVDPMWQLLKRLPRYARLTTALARDGRVPSSAKAMLAAGGVYLVSPIDLVPGFIPVAGQLDDLYVILLGLRGAIRATPADVIDEHFARIGLPVSIVDDDLAAIRTFVRLGIRWSIHEGGRAITRLSREAVALARRTRHDRHERKTRHDQNPRAARQASPKS